MHEEEQWIWDSGVMRIASPKALQCAVFFYVGKHFCIRGVRSSESWDHHSLSEHLIQIATFMWSMAPKIYLVSWHN